MTTTELLPLVPESTLSNADLPDLIDLLKQQFTQRVDHIVPTSTIRLNGGNLELAALDEVAVPAQMTENGVTGGFSFDPSGLYKPNRIVDSHLASLFEIPLRYVRRLREQDVELLDINVNRWAAKAEAGHKRMLRTVYGQVPNQPGLTGIVRAILSDRYLIMDNLDAAMSVLSGLAEGGFGIHNIRALNLTESRMYIDVEVPEVAVAGRSLVQNYVSPFTGQTGAELPLVHAGVRITNSEIGMGKLSATPYCVFEVCANGAQMNVDALQKVHLGGALGEGTIDWSTDTRVKADELVRAQVRDAISHFVSEDYLNSVVDRLEKDAGVEITRPETVIETVAKEMAYTAEEQDNILNKFFASRKFDTGGVYQAVTAAAQDIKDFDRRFEVEGSAPQVMAVAAKAQAKVSAS